MKMAAVLAALFLLSGACHTPSAESSQLKAKPKSGSAKQRAKSPIKKDAVFDALRIGGLNTTELVTLVKDRGVDFQITDEDERELRAVGARPALIEAIRENYRGRSNYRGRRVEANAQTPSRQESLTQAAIPPEFKGASVFIFYTNSSEGAARELEASLRSRGVTKVSVGPGVSASGQGTMVYGSAAYDFSRWLKGNYNVLASFPLIDTRSAGAGLTEKHVVISLW